MVQKINFAIGIFLWASTLTSTVTRLGLGAQKQALFPAQNEHVPSPPNDIFEEWNFVDAPDANSTVQLVFSTVQNLLQLWPNTRYRNGHTIVPGIVPVGTLLYHDGGQSELPTTPEWVATDPEHAYVFCAPVSANSGCWHATLVVTRPLRILYFDGSSAAKMPGGSLDAQDFLLWGEVRPDRTNDELDRIVELCDWGERFGLDGFVRMAFDFEIMLCDFTAGIELVSLLNLATPAHTKRNTPPTVATKSPPFPLPMNPALDVLRPDRVSQEPRQTERLPPKSAPRTLSSFRSLEGGSWHKHFPGETRIKLDYTRLISFYDPRLFPGLIRARKERKRLDHRLDALSKEDLEKFRGRLEDVLSAQDKGVGSGVDWSTLLNLITQRYAERLEVLAYILNTTDAELNSEEEAEAKLRQAHRHIGSMVVFYVAKSDLPPDSESRDHAWAASVFKECATAYTRHLNASALGREFTESETLLLGAVKGVQKEICRVLVGLWAQGIELNLDNSEDARAESSSTMNSLSSKDRVAEWIAKVDGLMSWLDWSYWLRCRPACSYEETCYITTWPFIKHPWGSKFRPQSGTSRFVDWFHDDTVATGPNDNGEAGQDLQEGDWDDPQPKCIRRVEPFLGFQMPESTNVSGSL